jgi:hypothetical protein
MGLLSSFGAGVALKGLQVIKASERLSGLFGKFSDAVSRAQMPIGLELQAGRLYSGPPLDAVRWKGFARENAGAGERSAKQLTSVEINQKNINDQGPWDPDTGQTVTAGNQKTIEAIYVPNSSAVNSALHARHVDELSTLNRQGLLDELGQNGIKYTPENIVDIRKTQDGKIVFLETGNRQAGLEHILVRHQQDFANVGIHADQIPDAVMTAVTQGKVIGYQGKNQGRTIYDTVFNDTRHQISVTVSDNGFIVGANPQSRLSPYITE